MENQDYEAAYQKHKHIVNKSKQEYECAINDMFNELSAENLEPLRKFLVEQLKVEFNAEHVISELKQVLRDYWTQITHRFFETNNVDNNLIILEILKERFKSYEGTNWNVHKLTPEERTRPVRMRIKDAAIKNMKKQVEKQNQELTVLLEKNKAYREQIQSVKNERTKMFQLMKTQTENFDEMKSKMLELQNHINDDIFT